MGKRKSSGPRQGKPLLNTNTPKGEPGSPDYLDYSIPKSKINGSERLNMKKVDVHTAAAVLEDELYALLQDIRKARFVMDQVWDNIIQEDDLPKVSREILIVSATMTNQRIDIINDYLFAASQRMDELYKLCREPDAKAC